MGLKSYGNKQASIKVDVSGVQKLQLASPLIWNQALSVVAMQFLTWANAGSKNESKTPPIRFGVLRGSSSAFVGSRKVGDYKINIRGGAKTSADTYTGVPYSITWVWNTDYAKHMHEGVYNPGAYSRQSGNAGPKWLEKHLQADKDAISELTAIEINRRVNAL